MNGLWNIDILTQGLIERELLIAALVVMVVLLLLMGILYPVAEAQERIKNRTMAISSRRLSNVTQDVRSTSEQQKRRKIIAESLQDITNQNEKKRRVKLDVRLAQAGLEMTPTVFTMIVIVAGLISGYLSYVGVGSILPAMGVAIILIFGAPIWLLNYLRKRRIDRFVLNFPLALETIVRGVRAGLPLNDCFTVIAAEAQEPVKSEFRMLIESLMIGLTLGEATERMAERIPTPETTFFSIVLAIQEKTGGNLGETLANLSNVLRDRKKLRDKVKALTTEAKVSAGIIGSMPFLVMLGVYATTPDYLTLLFTTNFGKMILGGGLIWMLIGIIIMRFMMNFEI